MSCNKNEDQIFNDIHENPEIILKDYFTEYEIVTLDEASVITKHQERFNFRFDLKFENHPEWIFDLQDDKNDAEDFQLYEIGADGIPTPFELNTYAYAGYATIGETRASFLFFESSFNGNIKEEHAEYMIEPLRDYVPYADKNQYVVYDVSNINDHEKGACDHTDETLNKRINMPPIANKANCHKVEFSYLGDYQLYRDKFSSNINDAFNWMYSRYYFAGRRYKDAGYNLDFIRKGAYLFTSNATVASTTSNRTKFVNEWKDFGNQKTSWYNRGDVNILFTGQDVINGKGEYGWSGTSLRNKLCNLSDGSNAYGFMEKHESNWRTSNGTAHEVGHIMGANHVSTGFMLYNAKESSMSHITMGHIDSHIDWYPICVSSGNCN